MSLARIDGVSGAGIERLGWGSSSPTARPSSTSSSGSFSDLLSEQLRKIEGNQQLADNAVQQLTTGQTDNVQDVVLTMAEADLTFRFAVELRNRLLESYQEILRMQV
jgi:flagellar hook-basal body complex protein FliE